MSATSRDRVLFACVALFSAAACTSVYLHVLGSAIDSLPAWHQGHLDNVAHAPDQYRLLSFVVPEVLVRLGFGVIDAYTLLRVFYLAGALFVSCYIGLELGLARIESAFVVVGMALYYAASTQAHFQMAQEPTIFVFALVVLLLLRRASMWLIAPVFFVGLLYAETIGFLIPFALLIWALGSKLDRRTALRNAAVLSMIFVIGYVALRVGFGTDRPYLGGLWQIDDNVRALTSDASDAYFWLLASVVPAALLARRWRTLPIEVRVFFPTVVLFVIGHLMISKITEFRTYTPLIVVLWPALLATFTDETRSPTEVDTFAGRASPA